MDDTHAKLLTFYRKHRRMPSYSEIMRITGYKSKAAVAYALEPLLKRGVIKKDASGRLIPHRLQEGIRMLGTVEAGFPSPAEEELTDTMSFDDYLIGADKEASYILRVKGDSMIDAGICDGDMVVAVRKSTFKDGDIVIASVDGEWTIKYYRNRKGEVYLEPANEKYKPIYAESELRVVAIVKAVVRRYS